MQANEYQFVSLEQYDPLQFLKQKQVQLVAALTRVPLGMKPPRFRSHYVKEGML